MVGTALLWCAYALVLVPVWAWHRLRGNSMDRRGPGRWEGVEPTPDRASRPMHAAPDRTRPSIALRLTGAIGVVVLVLAADFGIGWAWDRTFPTDSPPPAGSGGSVASVAVTGDGSPPKAAGGVPDPRASSPAMAGQTWAVQYFADLQRQSFVEWPLTGDHPVDFTSRYINIEDWARRTWEPATSAADRPAVWFFGGSAMFGEGQRDHHTIASEVARLAAADGVPITAVNYGQRGWVHWQEMLLYEQELAQRPAPAVAVFMDGENDLTAGGSFGDAVPATLHAKEKQEAAGRSARVTRVLAAPSEGTLRHQLWEAYAAHSAVRKVARWAGLLPARADAAAAASPAQGPTTTTPAAAGSSGAGTDGSSDFATIDDVRAPIEVYRRGRRLTDYLSREHGVAVDHFLQPQYYKDYPTWTYVREHWPQPTTDLSEVMGDQADHVYLDGVHTNELGARLVAEAMWRELEPQVRAWYRTHR